MVRPVDLQDNLSKTQLLERINQLQKSAPEEAQKYFAQEQKKKAAGEKNKTVDLQKSDMITIHADEEKKKDREKSKKGKQDKQKKPDDAQNEVSKNINWDGFSFLYPKLSKRKDEWTKILS